MPKYVYSVGLAARDIDTSELDPAQFEAHLDQVLEELERLDVEDGDYGGSLRTGRVLFSFLVEADSVEESQSMGNAMVRTAIHAAGGHTPQWRDFVQRSSTSEAVDEPGKGDLIEA